MSESYSNIRAIKKSLVNDVADLLSDDQQFIEKDPMIRYVHAFEFCSFLFEGYREQFQSLVSESPKLQMHLSSIEVESILFISWCSQEIFHRLNGLNSIEESVTLTGEKSRPELRGIHDLNSNGYNSTIEESETLTVGKAGPYLKI